MLWKFSAFSGLPSTDEPSGIAWLIKMCICMVLMDRGCVGRIRFAMIKERATRRARQIAAAKQIQVFEAIHLSSFRNDFIHCISHAIARLSWAQGPGSSGCGERDAVYGEACQAPAGFAQRSTSSSLL